MQKFKLISKFKEGQTVWFIRNSKITSGTAVGFEGCSFQKYYSNESRIEVKCGFDDHEVVKESEAFTSKTALLKNLKQ